MNARTARNAGDERGEVLVVALVTMFGAAASVTTTRRDDVAQEDRELQARALADAGVNRAITFVQDSMRLSPFDPFAGLDAQLFANGDPAQPQTFALATDEALADGARTF